MRGEEIKPLKGYGLMKLDARKNKTKADLIAELETQRERLEDLESTVTERQKLIDTLQSNLDKYSLLLDESSDPIFMFGPNGTYRYANMAFANGVDRKPEEIIDHRIWDVFSQDEADKRFAMIKWVFENGITREIEVRVPRPDGDHTYLTTVKPVMGSENEVVSVICISKNITERKHMEDDLRHLSTHDSMTDLYNRHFFHVEMKRIQESRLFPVSIVSVDVDGLKMVNDKEGHDAGDAVIITTARSLRESFRNEDIIARLGGDEFVVLLPETNEEQAREIITRLRRNIEKQKDESFSLSIGVATGQKGCSLSYLMYRADECMYVDKATHRKLSQ
jgi:diguanylate cyclase (GGDEF)-like protein/PAS domain S-box-containing protein